MIQILSNRYRLHGIANSKQGGRAENQDDIGFLETPLGFLLVVCDGMGGGPGGKTASYIAKHEIFQVICSSNPQASREEVLKMAISRANEALYRKMEETPLLKGMGSTVVAILINETSALIAHLGDSRCYRLHGNRVMFRTSDHSLVHELVRNKAMTEEQARLSPQSNVITRALGNTSNHVPDITEVPFLKGDRFVLCTDGVWGVMPEKSLIQRFSTLQDVTAIAMNLASEIDETGFVQGGHHDNHTLAIIEMETDSILKDKMNRQTKIILAVLSSLVVISLTFNIIGYLKLGARPHPEALQKASREIERLTPYENLYNELTTKKDTKLYNELYTLKYQNDSLRKYIMELEEQIEASENKANDEEVVKPTKKQGIQKKQSNILAQKIINQLKAMKNAKAKNIKQVAKKKEDCRNEIIKLLNQFDNETNGKHKQATQEIRKHLSKDATALKIDQKDKNGDYKSTKIAQRSIDALIEKVEEIKKEIK